MNYVYSRYVLLSRGHKGRFIVIDGGLGVEPVYLIPPSSLCLQPSRESAIPAPIKFTYR